MLNLQRLFHGLEKIVIPGILLGVAIVLVLVDRIFDYHISGTLFFTGLFCICFSIIIYTIKSDTDSGFPGILCTSFYMIFFYLSVYYRFIPAWTMKTVWGIILFILLNFGFATASFIAYYIVNFAEEIFKSNDGILIIVILEKIFGIILIIATVLLLYTLAKFLLSLGFKDNYRSVIIEGSPRIMILIMNFLIGT